MKTYISILGVLISLTAFCQNNQNMATTPDPGKGLKFSSFNINLKPISIWEGSRTFSDLSSVLPSNDSFFKIKQSEYNISNTNGSQVGLNVSLGLSKNPKRELRIGFNYLSGIRSSFYFSKETHKAGDTFVVKNVTFYSDSVYRKNYDFSETVKQLGLDVSYIFRTDPAKRFQFFTGLGIAVDYSIYSAVDVYTSYDSSYYITPDPDYQPIYTGSYGSNGVYENKTAKTDPSLFIKAYLPLGMNLRLGNKNEFWKHLNIYSQFDLGLEYRYITNDKGYLNTYLGMGMLGIRYTF